MFIPGNIIPLGTAEVPSFHYLTANGCYHSVPLQSLRIRLVHCSNWRPHGICIEHGFGKCRSQQPPSRSVLQRCKYKPWWGRWANGNLALEVHPRSLQETALGSAARGDQPCLRFLQRSYCNCSAEVHMSSTFFACEWAMTSKRCRPACA